MTTLTHTGLSKTDRRVPGTTERQHSARCTCGYQTLWLPTLREVEERMDQHVYSLRGQTFVSDLSPTGIAFRRRLDDLSLQIAGEAMREDARVCKVNADLRAERLASRSERVLWGAIVFLIIAFGSAAVYFHVKGEAQAAQVMTR